MIGTLERVVNFLEMECSDDYSPNEELVRNTLAVLNKLAEENPDKCGFIEDPHWFKQYLIMPGTQAYDMYMDKSLTYNIHTPLSNGRNPCLISGWIRSQREIGVLQERITKILTNGDGDYQSLDLTDYGSYLSSFLISALKEIQRQFPGHCVAQYEDPNCFIQIRITQKSTGDVKNIVLNYLMDYQVYTRDFNGTSAIRFFSEGHIHSDVDIRTFADMIQNFITA